MWLWLLAGLLASAAGCPEKCKCQGTTVDCSSQSLSFFPKDIPQSTGTLNFRSNYLGKLTASDLRLLPNLQTLLLGDNHIKTIEENALDAAPKLRRLAMARNRLTTVPPLATASGLVSLDLRHNKIREIDPQAFTSLKHLMQLDISHNSIQSVASATFKSFEHLNAVYLHANPWNCDCRIANVVKALEKSSNHREIARCFNPPNIRGTSVANMTVPLCFQPVLTKEELHTTLTCPVSDRQPVVWLFKNSELDVSSVDSYQLLDAGDLLVPPQQPVDEFTCAADYVLVPQRSLRQTRPANSGSAPQFTYKPKDSSYREGTAVKLHCEVIGNPKPAILWFFKGKRLIPTRKYEFSHANSVLKVYPFLEEDVGSYKCEAVNAFGRIEHSARLELISSVPPQIIDPPAAQTAEVGQKVTFRCRAKGVPRPDITWFFDGSYIPHIRGRIMESLNTLCFNVSDDGWILTITNVGRGDDGVFSCMAGNSVGAMVAEARLKVRGDQNVDNLVDTTVIQNAVVQARSNIDRAVNNTRKLLSQEAVTDPNDLKRLFRFSIPAQAVELSKAREIYEESIRLVHEHVQKGMKLPVSKLAPNVSYEAVLSPSHVQTIMELSGCMTGQILKDSCSDICFHSKYRAYDGQCNNFENPMWGVSSMPLQRLLPPVYENGFNTPVGWEKGKLYHGFPKPNPRKVSRQLVATRHITPHSHLSAMVMQWGQFVDHDLTHTPMALSRSSYASGAICNRTCENLDPCFNIPLESDDPKLHTGLHVKYPCIEFERSGAVCGSGETSLIFQRVTYRDQMNIITSYLDGSLLYGSSEAQALELRDLFGDHGLMRFDIVSSSQKPYLPFEKDSDMDCKRNVSLENPIRCFLAGDLRANEQLGLTSMHTILLREHNRIAANLLRVNSNWDGETIYQETRKIIGAQMQHITYNEWLPTILGRTTYDELIGEYKGYKPNVNPSITNAFATAAFRFGHTLINPTLFRLDKNFKTIPQGHLPLHKAFFAPERLLSEGGLDPLIRGLFASPLKLPRSSQLLNTELTEKLFNSFHEVALDLASMNIQRSRDHGLPGYTEYRKFCNLSVPSTWDELAPIVRDSGVRSKLQALYGHPANIDLWVGGIVEDRTPDALMGPTFACIIADQFKRLRDGDRFWYENEGVFNKLQLQQIKKSSLARIFCDNGDEIDRVQQNVFHYYGNSTTYYEKCEAIPSLNLNMWQNCCDTQCSVNTSNSITRKRRAEQSCLVNNERKKSGSQWESEDDKCTVCKCESGHVWCSVKSNCDSSA